MNKFVTLLWIAGMAFFSCQPSDSNKSAENAKADEKAESGSATLFQKVEMVWSTDSILAVPESVCYFPDDSCLFVSNVNGKPSEKDGNGFISKISLDGQILELKWLDGIDAPKGMGVLNGQLFVANIDEVIQIDIQTVAIINRLPVQQAKFLNDIAVDTPGEVVYISDMEDNKIYKIENNKIEEWLATPELVQPNGLRISGSDLLIGINDRILAVDTETKEQRVYIENTGPIDGLVEADNDNFIISDWAGKVQVVSPKREPIELSDTTEDNVNAADIEYIPELDMLFVPTFFANSVIAYKVFWK